MYSFIYRYSMIKHICSPQRAYLNDPEDSKSRLFSTIITASKMSRKKIYVHDISHGYILNDGSSLWLLKSMPRMHKTTNRNVLTYLFATYWLYWPYFRWIIFNVPFTVYEFCFVGLEFGLLTIFSKLVFRMCQFCGCRNFALQVIYAKLIF